MVHFDPPLSASVAVAVPSTLSPGSRLRLHATLSRDEFAHLSLDGTKVQVWSDFNGTWAETSFEEEGVADVHDEADVDLSLTGSPESTLSSSEDQVLLVATTPLPSLIGRTVQFTYRLVQPSGAVTWLGSEGTNGSIFVEKTYGDGHLRAEDWSEDEHGIFSWKATAGSGPIVVAKLGRDADWRGWAIGQEGPSRFTAVSSAVTEMVALALLPKARPGAYVSYEPVLYHTTANATLSLTDSGEILFHAGDGESVLHASISTSTWRDSIGDSATTLDTSTPHFLGVSVQGKPDVGHVHFLPMSGSQATVAVKSANIKSLVSSSPSLAMVALASQATKFLAESCSDESLRVCVGPAGGEVLILPGYSLRGNGSEWVVAFLPDDSGNVAAVPVDARPGIHSEKNSSSSEEVPSESSHSEESAEHNTVVETHPGHSQNISNEMLLIIATLFRFILELVAGSIALSSSPKPAPAEGNVHEATPLLANPSTPEETTEDKLSEPKAGPELAFKVTGKYTIVIGGEELSDIFFSVDGKPLQATPKEIGGNWLIEGDADVAGAQLVVALHE